MLVVVVGPPMKAHSWWLFHVKIDHDRHSTVELYMFEFLVVHASESYHGSKISGFFCGLAPKI